MDIRRVVTGQAASGAAVLVSDARIAPTRVALMPGAEFHGLWGADAAFSLPSDGAEPEHKAWFPPADGFRFGLFTLAPASAQWPPDFDLAAALVELDERLPGMADVLEPDEPGMHTSDTVDYCVVLSGQAQLELDDGKHVDVRAGDCVVQNGTRHRWHNLTEEPCVMAVALIGRARRS
jgi:mannose-6-phosphate isomerase-like protein (cupin superfamily)